MKVLNCEGCNHPEDKFSPLLPLTLTIRSREKIYMLCPVCHEKIGRIIEGGTL